MLSVILKSVVLVLYFLVSSYVFTFGKPKTGIRLDYVFFTIFCILALFRL